MGKINMPDTTEQYGSFKLVEIKGNHKMFMGLSSDVTLLPNEMQNTITGSTAFCVDTGEVWFYEETSKTWYQI
jgi:hypothetical protein